MAMRVPAAVAVLLVAAAASMLAAGAAAQSSGTPACASKLVGCASYMNGTDAQKPPETCCGPLRDAVKNEKACLCPSTSPMKSPPGSSSPSGGKSAGHRTMSASFAGLMSLFLVLWSVLA